MAQVVAIIGLVIYVAIIVVGVGLSVALYLHRGKSQGQCPSGDEKSLARRSR
jgi:hypothetical protein